MVLGRLNNLSIRRKLTVITMATGMVTLAMACAAFLSYDLITFRQWMVKDLGGQAEIVGAHATTAISQSDRERAAGVLRSLRTQPQIVAACIHTATGRRLASYLRDPAEGPPKCTHTLAPGSASFEGGLLIVSRKVIADGRPIGTVIIQSDLSPLYARVRSYALIIGIVLSAASLAGLLLVHQSQRLISAPILHLTETARLVTAEKQYSIRATRHGDDEIGLLIDCFNEMLERIQRRDLQLKAHRDHLEEQVELRTEEISAANSQLTTAKDRAEQANRAKSAFLANMSHEIRTPMTAIIGYADMVLEAEQTPAERQDCLQVIRRNSHHLLEIINDILDLSKIEAEKLTIEQIACDLPQIIADIVSLMRPRAQDKGLEFRLTFAPDLPRHITCDPVRLKQILINLVGNAVKFTERGSIELAVACHRSAERNTLEIRITDTGIGMAPAQVSRLYQPFTQADESTTRRFGGTGLGLVITKRLAEAMGGGIAVESQPGVGSTFTVRIDAGALDGVQVVKGLSESLATPAHDPVRTEPIRLSGRILLAEDGIDNQRLLCAHLRKAGATVTVAANGRIAVEAARAEAFDLILMDMQMPEMDGYTAARTLRDEGRDLPIVALTAHAMSGDREKCLAAGCSDYLTKPVRRDRLLTCVAAHLRARTSRPPVESPAAPSPAPERPAETRGTVIKSTFAADDDMKQIVGEFVAELPAQTARLKALLDAGDLAELRRAVHQLKGAGGGYGFADITTLATQAEQSIRQEAQLERVAADVRSLVDLLRQVEGYDAGHEAPTASSQA
jgi:signal transduction histidine kinase/DNA-binding response OmpR family regulator